MVNTQHQRHYDNPRCLLQCPFEVTLGRIIYVRGITQRDRLTDKKTLTAHEGSLTLMSRECMADGIKHLYRPFRYTRRHKCNDTTLAVISALVY